MHGQTRSDLLVRTGNTQAMAQAVAEGAKDAGQALKRGMEQAAKQ